MESSIRWLKMVKYNAPVSTDSHQLYLKSLAILQSKLPFGSRHTRGAWVRINVLAPFPILYVLTNFVPSFFNGIYFIYIFYFYIINLC